MSVEIRVNNAGQTRHVAFCQVLPRVVKVKFDEKTRVAKVWLDNVELQKKEFETFAKCGESPHLVIAVGETQIVIAY